MLGWGLGIGTQRERHASPATRQARESPGKCVQLLTAVQDPLRGGYPLTVTAPAQATLIAGISLMNASSTSGSKCVPRPSRIVCAAASSEVARRNGRSRISES